MWVIWLASAALGIFLIFIIIKCIIGRGILKRAKRDSLIIYGKKGKGKTLLFSEMTRMDKKGFLSTTDFKRKEQEIITYNDVNLNPNTWENVLNGQYFPIRRNESWEGKPIYLDDAGVFIPNFADSMLKKHYESLPISFAVWRHLYNAPIHINSQDVERAWKMVREQADGFIQVRGCVRIGPFAFIKCTYYDHIESAKQCLLPMKVSIFNKFNKAELNLYNAQHGEIKDFLIFAPTWRNRYDSRYFKSKFFVDGSGSQDTKTANG